MSRGYWPGVLFEKRCYACGGQPRSAPPCQNILTLFGRTSAVQDIQNVVIDNALSEPQRNLSSCNRRRIESCYLQLHTFLLAERIKVFLDAILVLFPVCTCARPLLFLLGFPALRGILSLFGLFRLLPVFLSELCARLEASWQGIIFLNRFHEPASSVGRCGFPSPHKQEFQGVELDFDPCVIVLGNEFPRLRSGNSVSNQTTFERRQFVNFDS